MLIVLVNVTVKPEALAEFEPAILENAAASVATEPGCLRFDVNQSEDHPASWMFYEVYTDLVAFEAHRASAHYAKYAKVAERAVVSKTVDRYVTKNMTPR